jgi:hypothetical protein
MSNTSDYKVFLCHYTPLADRQSHMVAQLTTTGLTDRTVWITRWDREALSESGKLVPDGDATEKTESEDWLVTKFNENALASAHHGECAIKDRRRAVMSLVLKHVDAWRQISTGSADWGLVLEDDVIMCDGFATELERYVGDLVGLRWDMLFVGDGCGMHYPKDMMRPGTVVYEKTLPNIHRPKGPTRCADSYVVTRECAKKMMGYYDGIPDERKRIMAPADLWLNKLIDLLKLRVWWGEPTLVTQGSQNGTFNRSVGKQYMV